MSHDHHDGLVVAQGLILGRSKAPRSTWPVDRRQQVDRVLEFFETTLQWHFEAEEAHLFPVVERQLRNGVDLVRQLRADHDDMRARVRDLAEDPVRDLEDRLPAFGECLKTHIQREERVLFERMQAELDSSTLEEIGAALRSADASTPRGSCTT